MGDNKPQDSAQLPNYVNTQVLTGLQHLIAVNNTGSVANSPTKAILVNVVNSNDHSGANQKLLLTASPKIVPNFIITPPAQAVHHAHLNLSPPAKKKLKLCTSSSEHAIAVVSSNNSLGGQDYRRKIIDHKYKKMQAIKERYSENASELFFLSKKQNIMDYPTWRKKPTHEYYEWMKRFRIESDEDLPRQDTTPLPTPEPPTAEETRNLENLAMVNSSTSVCQPAVLNETASSFVDQEKKPEKTVVNTVTEAPVNNQDEIVEKAKQEAHVMQKIAHLQREGLWSEKRLPKVQEPSRPKSHWDYLLEEMVWLSTDFAQERKWKKSAAKKCARMVQKYFQEKAIQAEKAKKTEEERLRKIAGAMAKEVKAFWSDVEKLVEYQQQTRLEEKRKKALDQHLNFIVDQTEKYSSWITEGLNKNGKQSTSASVDGSGSPSTANNNNNRDEEFEPNQSSDDDEETIAKAEEECQANHKEEIEMLLKESEVSIEDILKDLPSNYFESNENSNDTEMEASDEPSDESEKSDESETEDEDEEEEEFEDEDSNQQEAEVEQDKQQVGLKSLLEDFNDEQQQDKDEFNDVAALAESIQPKGNTLSTTKVVTKVPFLLKHQLREYQHIGLDWLVTMHDRKLNGILADEMGLGKTIQTIALLAHLACEKANWGPHLIVVPTSVILNWEMEFKKWCPSFKILTYYGTQKERKLKRQGWTKPNAFHVCITSYKLVIQDHQSFRRKKWRYFILDEAQNIKNFKSQRWQLLLNFQTQRRLLLTGTPLQNNLMELWSLMHFLMPNVFSSHSEFKEWFSNPVTGMIEGNNEYNENIIRRLHKVLRPFLLRRLKCEVEKQLPKKYEHIVMCKLSKRQRLLYDDFMSRAKTKETLNQGNLLSVINVLMQLRKICNHPNLFDVRPTNSPFQMESILYQVASACSTILDYDPLRDVDLSALNLRLVDLELTHSAFVAHRSRALKTPKRLIEEIDTQPDTCPRCPAGKVKINVRYSTDKSKTPAIETSRNSGPAEIGTSPQLGSLKKPHQPLTLKVAGGPQQLQGISLQLVPHPGTVKAIPVGQVQPQPPQEPQQNKINLSHPSIKLSQLAQLVPGPGGKSYIISGLPAPHNSPQEQQFITTTAGGQKLTIISPKISKMLTKSLVKVSPEVMKTIKPTVAVQPQPQIQVQKLDVKSLIGCCESCDAKFDASELNQIVKRRRASTLQVLGSINDRRCAACPIYGQDLVEAFGVPGLLGKNCTEAVRMAVRGAKRLVQEMRECLEHFVVYIPAVQSQLPQFHCSHPPPQKLWHEQRQALELKKKLGPKLAFLHPVMNAMTIQFPDARLIQYDCGKLQSLDLLLRRLKREQHRVLVFTQMTRMLDVLEAFLNYHGHIYLRLDGSTKVEQRQVLMEKFNNDKRIFCFILSTRSGGIGVNLTGADTVIFYDSDWNPTMDAQAQDRCHRIGQTRDVHIYRLISDRTVEENILKKANQKRLLADIAIEEGGFTTAYFKSSTIHDLFNVNEAESDAQARMAEVLDKEPDDSEENSSDQQPLKPSQSATTGVFESAIATVEDDQDVQATKTAKAEASAELAEFDEDIPLNSEDTTQNPDDAPTQISKAEKEIQSIVAQLKPIERYAMRVVEQSDGQLSAAQLAAAEQEIEERKREWEVGRLRALKEEEDRQTRLADNDDTILTFGSKDAKTEMWVSINRLEVMPMWCPPTPPASDDDVYIDHSLGFLYGNVSMPDIELPPVYVKKEEKTVKEPQHHHHHHHHHHRHHHHQRLATKNQENIPGGPTPPGPAHYAPRSLFDRPAHMLAKIRRTGEAHHHKYKGMPGDAKHAESEQSLDWMIHEDQALLQAVQEYQGLPLNLMIMTPGHTPNWDLVSDIVNNTSRVYRSPKQCRSRYEYIIAPREEGKSLCQQQQQQTSKKQKKLMEQMKVGQQQQQQQQGDGGHQGNRPLKTWQLYSQDKNHTFTSIYGQRYDAIRQVSNWRAPTTKSLLVNPMVKNPKHAELLDEHNIQYESPLSPLEVAVRRIERQAKERLKNMAQNAANANAGAVVVEQQQQQQQPQQQQQQQHPQVQQQQQAVLRLAQQHAVVVSSGQVPVYQLAQVDTTSNSQQQQLATTPNTLVKARAAGLTMTPGTPTAIVSIANLQAGQRISATMSPADAQKGIISLAMASTPPGAKFTPAQLQNARQQQQQQLRQHQLKNLQNQVAAQKLVGNLPLAANVTAQQARATLVKQQQQQLAAQQQLQQQSQSPLAKQQQTVSRLISDDVAASMAKRQQQVQQQAALNRGLVPAQILQQQIIAPGTPVTTTYVKQIRTAGAVNQQQQQQQQVRQVVSPQIIAQRKLLSAAGQKVQVAQVSKAQLMPQFLLQQKPLTNAMTVSHLQQVMKQSGQQGAASIQHYVSTGQLGIPSGHTVISKATQGQPSRILVPAGISPAQLRQPGQVQPKTQATARLPTARIGPTGNQVQLQTAGLYHVGQPVKITQQQQQQQQQQVQSQQQPNVPDNQTK